MAIGHLASVVDRGPAWLASLFEGSDANPELRGLLAATIAAEQCRLLCAAGVEQFHIYTLNRAKLTLAICHILGIRAPLPARPKAGPLPPLTRECAATRRTLP